MKPWGKGFRSWLSKNHYIYIYIFIHLKTNNDIGTSTLSIGYTSSNGGISVVILVVRGVDLQPLDIQNPPEVWCLSRMFWGSKYLQFRRLDVEGKFFFCERKTINMMLCTPPKTSISHKKIVVGRRLSVWKGLFLGFLGCFLGATQIPKSLPNDARNETFLVSMCFIHGWLYPETSVIRSFAVFGGQKLANHWRSVLNRHWNICFRQRWFWKTHMSI